MPWTSRQLAAGLAAMAGCAMAAAAARPPMANVVPFAQAKMKRVDQAHADTGALSTSLRQMGADLRIPSAWDSVYELERANGWRGGGQRRFARISGGVAAVFPASEYQVVPKTPGLHPTVPSGTVYYIGGVPTTVAPEGTSLADTTPPVASAVSRGVSLRVGSAVQTAAPSPARAARTEGRGDRSMPIRDSSPLSTVLEDESYRTSRCRDILLGAARFGAGNADTGTQAPR